MNKKIGLLTMHHTTNFGSALQTFALYSAVKELGCEIEVIDYRCKAVEEREFMDMSITNPKSVYRCLKYGASYKMRAHEFSKFLSENEVLSKQYDRASIAESNKLYDVFLVGSDIVWGLNVTGNDLSYFLDFADENKRKIAFGPSAGEIWPKEYVKTVGNLLKRFDKIGVRESAVAKWINDLYGLQVDEVADPTMLFDSTFWKKTAILPKFDKYILVYFCDPEEKILADAVKLGKKLGLSVKYINFGRKQKTVENIRPYKVEEFIGLIINAEYIFSASFHGLLFSLYFEKEVYYYNRANFSRMESLAEWLGIFSHNGLMNDVLSMDKICYEKVTPLIEERRNKSLNILKEYLNV